MLFEIKGEKTNKQKQLEEQRLQEEKEKQEEERIKQEKSRKEKEDFLKALEDEIKAGKIVICVHTSNLFKQIACNYLIEQGYVCVQNDVVATNYSVHNMLTFVREEFASKFIVKCK